jgi:hypothetical protein
MNSDENKYGRVLDLLRKSKPVLDSKEEIEEKVIRIITQKHDKKESFSGILDFLFGWVYVGWVRTGLVAASVILIFAFIYQQSVIIKRINNLNRQAVYIESQIITGSSIDPESGYFYRLAGRKLSSVDKTISEKQMRQVIKSYNELEKKYKDLIKLIEDDPELMKYFEGKLIENNKKKIKL